MYIGGIALRSGLARSTPSAQFNLMRASLMPWQWGADFGLTGARKQERAPWSLICWNGPVRLA